MNTVGGYQMIDLRKNVFTFTPSTTGNYEESEEVTIDGIGSLVGGNKPCMICNLVITDASLGNRQYTNFFTISNIKSSNFGTVELYFVLAGYRYRVSVDKYTDKVRITRWTI